MKSLTKLRDYLFLIVSFEVVAFSGYLLFFTKKFNWEVVQFIIKINIMMAIIYIWLIVVDFYFKKRRDNDK